MKNLAESAPPQPLAQAASPNTGEGRLWSRSFLSLAVAQLISLVGTQVSLVAVPWFVLATTGSPGKMVSVMLAEWLPLALSGAVSGALVDRSDYKRLMVALDVIRGFTTLTIPVLFLQGRLAFWVILAVSVVNGLATTPYTSARMALVPSLVGEDETRLTVANSLLQMTFQVAAIVGPALAGAMMAVLGNINVLFLDAGSYILAAFLIGLLVTQRRQVRPAPGRAPWYEELTDGLRFMKRQPLFRAALPLAMLGQLGLGILVMATVPVYAKQVLHGDAGDVGFLLSAFGLGSTVGMIVYGVLSARWPWRRGVTVLTFMLGMSLPLWLLPTVPRLAAAVIGVGLTGLFVGPLQVLIYTMLQTDTPPAIRGRVFSAFFSAWMAITPAGLAIAGPILERFGAIPMVWGSAALLSGTFLAAVSSRIIREA